jgi:hypothetical protein
MFVALGIEHATRMRRIVICGLPRSTKPFHIISPTMLFAKKNYRNPKMFVSIFSTIFV